MARHMVILRHAGLVVDRRDARWVRDRPNPQLAPEARRPLDLRVTLERNAP
jgi:ArsR family transcriptional regulator